MQDYPTHPDFISNSTKQCKGNENVGITQMARFEDSEWYML